MFNFLKKKDCSIPQEEVKDEKKEFRGFQNEVPTIQDLSEIPEMEELNPETEFMTNKEEEEQLERIREEIRTRGNRSRAREEEDCDEEAPYQAKLMEFDDLESPDEYAFRWGYHMGNWT